MRGHGPRARRACSQIAHVAVEHHHATGSCDEIAQLFGVEAQQFIAVAAGARQISQQAAHEDQAKAENAEGGKRDRIREPVESSDRSEPNGMRQNGDGGDCQQTRAKAEKQGGGQDGGIKNNKEEMGGQEQGLAPGEMQERRP